MDEIEVINDASMILALNNGLTEFNRMVLNKVRPLKWRQMLTPSSTKSPAVQFIEMRKQIAFADIRPIGPQDQVFPLGTEEKSNRILTVHEFGNALKVFDDEIERAAFAQEDSPASVRLAANLRIAEELVDRIVGIGYSDLGMYGMLNQPDVTPVSSPDYTDSGTSADAMLADLNQQLDEMESDTSETFRANRMVMPLEVYKVISRKIFQSNSPDTVLQVFQRQNPGVRIDTWSYCDTAGTGGRIMTWVDGDRDVLDFYMLRGMTAGQPVRGHFCYEIAYKMKLSGVYSLAPQGIKYSDGCLGA